MSKILEKYSRVARQVMVQITHFMVLAPRVALQAMVQITHFMVLAQRLDEAGVRLPDFVDIPSMAWIIPNKRGRVVSVQSYCADTAKFYVEVSVSEREGKVTSCHTDEVVDILKRELGMDLGFGDGGEGTEETER